MIKSARFPLRILMRGLLAWQILVMCIPVLADDSLPAASHRRQLRHRHQRPQLAHQIAATYAKPTDDEVPPVSCQSSQSEHETDYLNEVSLFLGHPSFSAPLKGGKYGFSGRCFGWFTNDSDIYLGGSDVPFHKGIDIHVSHPVGTPDVHSICPGKIVYVGRNDLAVPSWGFGVIVQCPDGTLSMAAHLDEAKTRAALARSCLNVGSSVTTDQIIGSPGHTGTAIGGPHSDGTHLSLVVGHNDLYPGEYPLTAEHAAQFYKFKMVDPYQLPGFTKNTFGDIVVSDPRSDKRGDPVECRTHFGHGDDYSYRAGFLAERKDARQPYRLLDVWKDTNPYAREPAQVQQSAARGNSASPSAAP